MDSTPTPTSPYGFPLISFNRLLVSHIPPPIHLKPAANLRTPVPSRQYPQKPLTTVGSMFLPCCQVPCPEPPGSPWTRRGTEDSVVNSSVGRMCKFEPRPPFPPEGGPRGFAVECNAAVTTSSYGTPTLEDCFQVRREYVLVKECLPASCCVFFVPETLHIIDIAFSMWFDAF